MRGLIRFLDGIFGMLLGGTFGLLLGGGIGVAIGCTMMPDSNLCGIFCIVTGPLGGIIGLFIGPIIGDRLAARTGDPANRASLSERRGE